MFMKHYAPNRCLYIKVAKLRTGVGSAEMSHLQNCSLEIYLKSTGGSSWGGGGVQDECERRMKVFVNIQKKLGGGGVGSGGSGWGGQSRCEQRSEVFVKIQKKIYFIYLFIFFLGGGSGRGVFGGGGGGGSQGGCEQRIEVFMKN